MKKYKDIYTQALPHRAKTVYMYLSDRANDSNQCWPGINRIARDLNLSRTTVKRGVRDLIDNQFITRELRHRENGGLSSNLYTILK